MATQLLPSELFSDEEGRSPTLHSPDYYPFKKHTFFLRHSVHPYHVGFREGASSLAKHREVLPLVGFLECRQGNREASRNSWKRYRSLSLSLSLHCCTSCYWLSILHNGKNVLQKWNVMAHAQKPDLVFQRKGRVHLYRRGCQFSRLLAAEVCASAVVMLDRPCPIQCTTAGYPLHSPFSPSLLHPCFSVCHHILFLLY